MRSGVPQAHDQLSVISCIVMYKGGNSASLRFNIRSFLYRRDRRHFDLNGHLCLLPLALSGSQCEDDFSVLDPDDPRCHADGSLVHFGRAVWPGWRLSRAGITYSVTSIPFSVWILKGYYATISKDLEEAAMNDGASRISAFYRIILPLSTPALPIVFLFNFMNAWNDYLLARIFLANATEIWTWPLGLQLLQGQFTTAWGQFGAASILVMIPVVALFLCSSEYLISGLTVGGVKG